MQDHELTLFITPGACSLVPMIVLEEIGVPYVTRTVALMAGEQRRPDYVKLNPSGKVPLLLVDGQPLPQNAAVLTFLAEAYPAAGLLPLTGEPLVDAQLLAKVVRFSADIHPFVTRIRMPHLFHDADPGRVKAQAVETIPFQLDSFERTLAEAPWLLGENYSLLDPYLHWAWWRITDSGFDARRFPAIDAHSARMAQRPAVIRARAREQAALVELQAAASGAPRGTAGGNGNS